MITIRLNSGQSLSEQIRAEIRLTLAEGTLKPGDPLPTVRQLAADLGVNLNTVARAYRALEEDGLVISVRGRGTVACSARDQRVDRDLHQRIRECLQRLTTDAKLAGLNRSLFEAIVMEVTSHIWRTEK